MEKRSTAVYQFLVIIFVIPNLISKILTIVIAAPNPNFDIFIATFSNFSYKGVSDFVF